MKLTSVVLLLVMVVPAITRAADDAQPAPAFNYVYISIASFKDLNAVAGQLGIPLPPGLSAAQLDQQFSFIGENGIDEDRPAGIIVFAKAQAVAPNQDDVIIVLPVKAAATAFKSVKEADAAVAVEGHPDMVTLGGMTFRQTEGYLMFGNTAAAVAAVANSDLTDTYKTKPANGKLIADIRIDMKSLRKSAPDLLQTYIDSVKKGAPADTSIFFDFIFNALTKLDRIEFGIAQTGQDLELSVGVSPFDLTAAGQPHQPAMPANVSIRTDCDTPEIMHSIARANEKIFDVALTGKFPEEQKQSIVAAAKSVDAVLFDESALSVGVFPAGDNTCVYIVEQREKPLDVSAALQQTAKLLEPALKLADNPALKESSSVDYQEYDDTGSKVSRVRIMNSGKPVLFIDAVAKGNNVYIAAAADDKHHVAECMSRDLLGNAGHMSGLLTGSVDMLPVFQQMMKTNDAPKMTPEQLRSMSDLFKGQTLRVSMTGENAGVTLKIDAATSVVKGIFDMTMTQAPQN